MRLEARLKHDTQPCSLAPAPERERARPHQTHLAAPYVDQLRQCPQATGRAQAQTLKVGDQAPAFSVASSTGKTVALADYLGKSNVVLFFYIGAFTDT